MAAAPSDRKSNIDVENEESKATMARSRNGPKGRVRLSSIEQVIQREYIGGHWCILTRAHS